MRSMRCARPQFERPVSAKHEELHRLFGGQALELFLLAFTFSLSLSFSLSLFFPPYLEGGSKIEGARENEQETSKRQGEGWSEIHRETETRQRLNASSHVRTLREAIFINVTKYGLLNKENTIHTRTTCFRVVLHKTATPVSGCRLLRENGN